MKEKEFEPIQAFKSRAKDAMPIVDSQKERHKTWNQRNLQLPSRPPRMCEHMRDRTFIGFSLVSERRGMKNTNCQLSLCVVY